MKKIIYSILATTLLVPTALAADFSDISEDSEYYKAVSVFSAEEIIEGYDDGTFRPDAGIIRAEALKVILLSAPDNSVEPGPNDFSDVLEEHWFIDYVREAVSRDVVQGYEDGTFKPAQSVNMAEALKMALVAKGITESDMSFVDFHPSVSEDAWFAKYMSYGFENNLYDINLDGSLNPTNPISRGQFVDMIYRVRDFSPNAEFDISYNWKEQTSKAGLEAQVPFYWDHYELEGGFFVGFFEEGKPNFVHSKPNTVRAAFSFWTNPEDYTATEYFNALKSTYVLDYEGSKVVTNEGIALDGPSILFEVEDEGVIDYFVYLEDGRLLAGQGLYDKDSLKAPDFRDELKKVFELANFSSDENLLQNSQKLSQVRENILVTGEGQELINLFEDSSIIETDTLGVGTGPIDYYYIEDINYTFKYERASDVILDIEEGRTTAF